MWRKSHRRIQYAPLPFDAYGKSAGASLPRPQGADVKLDGVERNHALGRRTSSCLDSEEDVTSTWSAPGGDPAPTSRELRARDFQLDRREIRSERPSRSHQHHFGSTRCPPLLTRSTTFPRSVLVERQSPPFRQHMVPSASDSFDELSEVSARRTGFARLLASTEGGPRAGRPPRFEHSVPPFSNSFDNCRAPRAA